MIFVFEDFELDTGRGELRRRDQRLSIEPRAFALLGLLVENHDRLVTKEEIIEKVWDGRVVSDAAVSTGVKSVRKVIGDDGASQKFVRTIRSRGFRFVSAVKIRARADSSVAASGVNSHGQEEVSSVVEEKKPSIAILPFAVVGYTETYSAIGDAIPTEIISSLSRLRWLRVIARFSSFRFRNRDIDIEAVRSSLGAGYFMSGVVEIFGNNLAVVVELVDSRSGDVVWSERFPSKVDDVHEIRAQIVKNVIAALELHIPLNEANRARLHAPDNLDAWGEYHIGLQHMYRFNSRDNAIAAACFERATLADPMFARAFAARSFTSFQSAFLKYSPNSESDKADARRFAERSLELDPIDPFGNFNLARTHWLEGKPDGGLEMLERATQINPNFAQAYYAKAWTDVMAGRGARVSSNIDTAISLSPLDPFLYAMQATRGLGYIVDSDYASAAVWAERGATAPGAHFLIGAIAIAAHQLNEDSQRASYWLENVRRRRKDASVEHFFAAFPFEEGNVRQTISRALRKSGF